MTKPLDLSQFTDLELKAEMELSQPTSLDHLAVALKLLKFTLLMTVIKQ